MQETYVIKCQALKLVKIYETWSGSTPTVNSKTRFETNFTNFMLHSKETVSVSFHQTFTTCL